MKLDSVIKVDSIFLNKDSGVSAVIGVILMVAVTAALATTVYIYVGSMPSPAEPVSTVVQAEYNNGDGLVIGRWTGAFQELEELF